MKTLLRRFLSPALRRFNVSVTSTTTLERLRSFEAEVEGLVARSSPERLRAIAEALPGSKAQLRQDVFALCAAGFKRDGFFVEFGATDGVTLSNTHLLESQYGWSGILAEPAHKWHDALRTNRTATIETDCVYSRTGERLDFREAAVGELSSLQSFADGAGDNHGSARRQGRTYEVTTVSLLDLLERHGAPRVIDYMSVDTEGSEYEILSAFDFARYDVRCLTIEHNYTRTRRQVADLLLPLGYERVFTGLSKWDDWYVKR